MATAPENAIAGRVLDGKYALHEVIGGGRFGQVYRATHIALQKPVAVKVLHAGDQLAARDFEQFRLEAEALGRLSHPHIVSVIDFGVDLRGAGTPYLVMELVEGETLEAVCSRAGAMDLVVAASWMRQIAAALDHAHELGVVHGDLTARNVLVLGPSSGAIVKVIDFGLARVARTEADRPSAAAPADLTARFDGTPEYAAPERLRGGPPSVASDIYALSVLAYRMLTGRHPFEGDTASVVRAQLTTAPPAPSAVASQVPAAVDALVLGGLSKRASERPHRASDVAHALDVSARQLARARWRRREGPRRVLLAGALAAVLAAAGPWLSSLTWVQRLEGATEDLRFALHPPVPPDSRVLLVSIDEESLAGDARPLSVRGDEFADPLARALSQGAAVVAFDLLLPEAWTSSARFADLLLEHVPRVVLAVASDGDGEVVGPEAVDALVAGALGPEAAAGLFGSVMQFPAADGTIRRASTAVADRAGGLRATLAGRVAEVALEWPPGEAVTAEEFLVDYTVDAGAIDRQNWVTFAAESREGRRFDNRIILVGAEFTGSGDRHRVPAPGRLPVAISGLTLQGVIVNTVLGGRPLREASGSWYWPVMGLGLLAMALPWLWFRRLAPIVLVSGGIALLACAAAVVAFHEQLVVAMAAALLLGLASVAVAAAFRNWLPARPE
jgi:CHASE2 domain-containing sensor protein